MAKAADTREKIEGFFAKYPARKYDKGEMLILGGENPAHIYFILSGHVKQYDITKTGEEVVVNIFKKPAFMPLAWAVGKVNNSFFFEAATILYARRAPAKDVTAFLKNNPDVSYDLLSRLYKGMDGLLKRNAYLMAGHARNRLVFELIIEADRFGEATDEGHIVKTNESEIGARAGLSRETVSRELNNLKKRDLLKTSRGGILINDLDKLRNFLSKDF